MPWSKLTDMAMTPEDEADYGVPEAISGGDRPTYPYGLRICLSDAELEKLGVKADCDVGDLVDMRCFGTVTSVSKNQRSDGTSCNRVEIQIEKIACENEMDE